mgnify:CR=1 FL=1
MSYSQKDTELIIKLYKEGKDVTELQQIFGKTRQSVISKLSSEGVYQTAKTASTPRGKPKKQTIYELAEVIDAEPEYLQSLGKAKKDELEYLLKRTVAELQQVQQIDAKA